MMNDNKLNITPLNIHKLLTMNSKEKGWKFEVNEEDDNSKVDESMWCWDPVGFFVENKNNGSDEWCFCIAKS